MADQAANQMIYTLGVTPGIKRDGTTFEAREYSDGQWVRFQRGVPKKIGGYRQMFTEPNGIPRGLITNAYNAVNYMFVGYNNGLDVFTSGTNLGVGAGPYAATLTDFTPDSRNLWQFDMVYDPSGGALKVLVHPGLNLNHIDNAVSSQVLVGDLLPGAGQTWSFSGLADTGGANPTNLPIKVDGGVCVLYPFTFVYGSNGFIANNNVSSTYGTQEINDWNGPLANQVNVAAGKIVKGMPVRGGTNSPSGMFWATDSLIRVSFTGIDGQYWRYDLISSQTSIISSNSVVELDGVFYWAGTDRFYQYNGSVSVLANDKNINWFYDNLNFSQRQKVWATKVPRYNEIWFFYPRGDATECTDAIIYNVKDKLWYDAGEADGARRSCGYTTEVFPSPIWCGWDYNAIYGVHRTVINTPPAQTPPAINQFYLQGDQTPEFPPGGRVAFTENPVDPTYVVQTAEFIFNLDTQPIGGATLITCTETFNPAINPGDVARSASVGYSVWQQEFGKNKVNQTGEFAIPSSFTTCDISWIGGDPAQDTAQGLNRRMHLRRVEPDFNQVNTMSMTVLGRKFARGAIETNGPFYFDPDTGKIDLRVEHREIRLQFDSNMINGDYEMGRIMITAEPGDERP